MTYLSVLIIFSDGFKVMKENSGLPFDIYFYYPIVAISLVIFFFYSKLRIFKPATYTLGVFLIIALFNVLLKNNTVGLACKQIFILWIMYSFYYYILKFNRFDYERLFVIYLNIAFIVACIGLFQVISFVFRFRYGYDLSWLIPHWGKDYLGYTFVRMHSILPEPAQYGVAMMPAFFISLFNLMNLKKNFISLSKSSVILCSMFFTFSLVAYTGVLFSGFLIFFRKGIRIKELVVAIVLIVALVHVYNTVAEVRTRIDDSYNIVAYQDTDSVNLSTFALYNNLMISIENFSDHPFFGTGIGSHPVIFDRYSKMDYENNLLLSDVNKGEAASMLLRLMSETGLLGLVLVIGFILKCHVGFTKNPSAINHILISDGILSLFFIKLLRSGHYFNTGLPFFVLIYYYNHVRFKARFTDFRHCTLPTKDRGAIIKLFPIR